MIDYSKTSNLKGNIIKEKSLVDYYYDFETNIKNSLDFFPLLNFNENLYNTCKLKYSKYLNNYDLDISSLSKGNYLLRAGNDKKAKTIKFIKD